MMKKYLMLFLVFGLLFLSGCFDVPSKISGPKWTTNMTLPLVFRTKNADGSWHTELRLDGEPNGVGEIFKDFTGDGSSIYAPGGEITLQGGTYGCIEIDSIAPQTLGPYAGPIPAGTEVTFSPGTLYATMAADYTGFVTSGNTINGIDTVNTLTVQISGGAAGVGGIVISVDDNGIPTPDTRTSTIAAGANNTTVELTNFQLINGVNVGISGSMTGGTITFTLSKIQVATMIIKGSVISNFPPLSIDSTPHTFDMSALVNESAHLTNCIMTFRITNMPSNLQIDPTFTINYYDSSNGLLNSTTHTLSFQNSAEETVTLTFSPDCTSLEFVVSQVTLDAVNPADNITINGNDTLTFAVRPQFSVESEPQSMEVSELDTDTIQACGLRVQITNNTQLGYEVNLYLSPNAVPRDDLSAVKLTFLINPAPVQGQPLDTNVTMSLTAENLAYLTGGLDHKVYNQIELIDLSTGKVLKTPIPYLEIRASASVSLLVNNGQNN